MCHSLCDAFEVDSQNVCGNENGKSRNHEETKKGTQVSPELSGEGSRLAAGHRASGARGLYASKRSDNWTWFEFERTR
jgi:hypothetical protein